MATDPPRRVVLTLTPEVLELVLAHARDMGLADKRAAVMDLIMRALSSSPVTGSERAARERAYILTKRWMIGRVQLFLKESAEQILPDLAEGDELDGGTDAAPIDPTAPLSGQL